MLIKHLTLNHLDLIKSFKSIDFSLNNYSEEGIGVLAARNKAKQFRNQKAYVLKTDISSFFDNLDRNKLNKTFKDTLDPDILPLFISLTSCDPKIPHDFPKYFKNFINTKVGKGVRQGMPLSPLVASYYLADFDEWLVKMKYKYVRYADDLIFFLDTEQECLKVFNEIKNLLLKTYKLELPPLGDDSKSQIIATHQTVSFLGLDLKYENNNYDWYIPQSTIDTVQNNLMLLANIENNIRNKMNFTKTVSRMDQILLGYKHCFKDANAKNLKDFEKRLSNIKEDALSLLFKHLGLDYSSIHHQYKNFLLS